MYSSILAVLSLFVLAAPLQAQDAASASAWENLYQLPEGWKVRVVDQKQNSWKGTLLRVSGTDIRIRVKDKRTPLTIPRTQVLRISSREREKHWGRALLVLGLGVGFAAAAIATNSYETFDTTIPGNFDDPTPGLLVTGTDAIVSGVQAVFPSFPILYEAAPFAGSSGGRRSR